MNKDSKIYIAGHLGLVGSAIMRLLRTKGYANIVTRTRSQLDLLNQQAVIDFFKEEKPEYVILAAAKVGGIIANSTYRGQFIYENLQIQNNVIHQSYVHGVQKLLFLGSSCIYPKNASQPMGEDCLLTGPLEYTNEPYAIAKIAGLKMCEAYNQQYGTDFIAVMPTNLYGENDNYDLEKSHVLPALIRKMHLGKCLENNDWEALRNDLNKLPIEGVAGNASKATILNKLQSYGISLVDKKVSVTLWGTGTPFREFLHSDDMADACVFLLENKSANDISDVNSSDDNLELKQKMCYLNIGTGKDISIRDLAGMVKTIIGFKGDIVWDTTKPDGTFKKLQDVSKLNGLGWNAKVSIEDGIKEIYNKYVYVKYFFVV
ncbi:MAG: GDP-L-fucose synthase [Labilibaculum sp.]|nr:GDP-L-fucose synthase [Labilibaculum sp.]